MEQGIFTDSTKERLKQLEEKKAELSVKIETERSKNKLLLRESDIIKYISTALKKDPRPMVDALVQKVILYNDKIQIFYNYTRQTPDGSETHRELFFTLNKSFEITRHTFEKSHARLDFIIELYV